MLPVDLDDNTPCGFDTRYADFAARHDDLGPGSTTAAIIEDMMYLSRWLKNEQDEAMFGGAIWAIANLPQVDVRNSLRLAWISFGFDSFVR